MGKEHLLSKYVFLDLPAHLREAAILEIFTCTSHGTASPPSWRSPSSSFCLQKEDNLLTIRIVGPGKGTDIAGLEGKFWRFFALPNASQRESKKSVTTAVSTARSAAPASKSAARAASSQSTSQPEICGKPCKQQNRLDLSKGSHTTAEAPMVDPAARAEYYRSRATTARDGGSTASGASTSSARRWLPRCGTRERLKACRPHHYGS